MRQAVTGSWVDIVPVLSVGGIDLGIQCRTADVVEVIADSAQTAAPADDALGWALNLYDSVNVNADHIWVRATGDGNAVISVNKV